MSDQPGNPADEKGDVATLAFLLACDEKNIYSLADRGVIPKPARRGDRWNVPQCVHRAVADLRKRMNERGKEARATLTEQQAAQEKIRTAEMEGLLCLKSQCIADAEDMMTKGAAAIGRLKILTTAQKEAVLKILRDVSLTQVEVEE